MPQPTAKNKFWIPIACLICVLVAAFDQPWGPWDQALFDANLRLRRHSLPPVSSRIAILGLTTDDLTGWSSTRQEYQAVAQAIADLRDQGASVIVIDLLLLRGETSDFEPFWKQVWKRDDVVLARSLEQASRLPGVAPASDSGLAMLKRDRDGLIRRYDLAFKSDKEWAPSLALAAYLKLRRQPWQSQAMEGSEVLEFKQAGADGQWQVHRFPQELHIEPRSGWSESGTRNFQHLSLTNLEQWKQEGQRNRLEGKVVFLANVAAGGGDIGSTVLDPATPKVAIHAIALNSLLQEQYYRPLPLTVRLLGAAVSFLLGVGVARFVGASRARRFLILGGLITVFSLPLISQLWLQVNWLVPWATWGICGWVGVLVFLQWLQSLWRWRMTSLRATADIQDPLVLKTLGSYLLVEKLGQGGFGAVYRGVPHLDLDSSKSVAVKIADPEASKNEDFRRRFLREGRISRSLRHPSIVRVLESGEQEGLLYYTMEWLRGGTLRDWLLARKGTPCSEQEARPILLGLLEAVAYAHGRSVLHRDLKPENVLLVGPLPKIVDFGLAHDDQSSQLTAACDIIGTVSYLAPERVQGSGYDARSDQYALGVIGYEMLAGCSPFPDKENPVEALMWRLTQDPTPLGSETPLRQVVDKMMARNPDDRFDKVEEAIKFLLGKATNPREGR